MKNNFEIVMMNGDLDKTMTQDVKKHDGERISRFSHADRRTWQVGQQTHSLAARTDVVEAPQTLSRPSSAPLERYTSAPLERPSSAPLERFSREPVSRPIMTPPPAPTLDFEAAFDDILLFEPVEAPPAFVSPKFTPSLQNPKSPPVVIEGAPVAGTSVVLHQNPQNRKKLAARAASVARAKTTAAVRQSVAVIARNANRSQLEENYTKALSALHRHVFDRRLEQLFFRPTAASPTHDAHPVAAPEATTTYRYDGPVPRLAFNWALSALPRELKSYAFVDFRAQRGRAMMLAARRNFERIIGYEYDEAMYDDLQMNVAQFPRSLMACRTIECVRGDLKGVIVPDQPLVVYFANAFREQFMSLIMSHVSTSYRLNPRRIYVILENPPEIAEFARDEIFYKINLPARERALLKVLSPVKLQIFRSLV